MSLLASFLPTVIKAVMANPIASNGDSKGLLASKTIQGAASLAIIPTMIFPLVDDLGAGRCRQDPIGDRGGTTACCALS